MLKKVFITAALLASVSPALAQGVDNFSIGGQLGTDQFSVGSHGPGSDAYSAGATGEQYHVSNPTGGSMGWTYPTSKNNVPLPRTSTGGLAPTFGGGAGLPPTRLDSFVKESGGLAFQIYGDEGTTSYPPLFGFNRVNRIDSGIQGQRNSGLTTGHESVLPSAWGWPSESSMSGDHGRNPGSKPGYPLDPGNGLPGATSGGGGYDPSQGGFPGSGGYGGGTCCPPNNGGWGPPGGGSGWGVSGGGSYRIPGVGSVGGNVNVNGDGIGTSGGIRVPGATVGGGSWSPF